MSDNKDPAVSVIKTLIICTCITLVAGLAAIGLAAALGNGC